MALNQASLFGGWQLQLTEFVGSCFIWRLLMSDRQTVLLWADEYVWETSNPNVNQSCKKAIAINIFILNIDILKIRLTPISNKSIVDDRNTTIQTVNCWHVTVLYYGGILLLYHPNINRINSYIGFTLGLTYSVRPLKTNSMAKMHNLNFPKCIACILL